MNVVGPDVGDGHDLDVAGVIAPISTLPSSPVPMKPTRSGLLDGLLVAEVHRAEARARDGAGGDATPFRKSRRVKSARSRFESSLCRPPFLQE